MDVNKKTQVIVPAAGIGARLKSSINKPFVKLKEKPLVVYSLEMMESCPLVDSVIVVAQDRYISDFDRLTQKYHLSKVKQIVPGGRTRCQSVTNGLRALDEDTEYVVIHDGARPLISLDVFQQAVHKGYEESAVVVGVPVKSTVKRVHQKKLIVEATLDRNMLWEIQTPQVFRRSLIINAHKKNKDLMASDDSMLVERAGYKVKVVRGDYTNIKITTPEDLDIAEVFLERKD